MPCRHAMSAAGRWPKIAHRGDARFESDLGVVSAIERLFSQEAHEVVVEIEIPVRTWPRQSNARAHR